MMTLERSIAWPLRVLECDDLWQFDDGKPIENLRQDAAMRFPISVNVLILCKALRIEGRMKTLGKTRGVNVHVRRRDRMHLFVTVREIWHRAYGTSILQTIDNYYNN